MWEPGLKEREQMWRCCMERLQMWIRTEIVTAYLVNNFGVDSQGVVTTWYGETNPTADNGTAGGRRLNRRVEIEVGGL